MGFWSKRGDKSFTASHQAIDPWPEAKKITKTDWESGALPIGWYFYEDGYGFRAIRPRADGQSVDTAWFQMYNIEQLVDWLGVNLPQEMQSKTNPENSTELDGQSTPEQETFPSEQISTPPESFFNSQPQSTLEQQWAMTKLQEVLRANHSPKPENRKRPVMERFRVTEEEAAHILNRVAKTELTKTEFLRQAALTSQVVIKPNNPELIQAIHNLTSELGRQGGLIAMWLKPNEGQRTLHPEEWDYLVQQVHYIEEIKPQLKKLMEDISNS